MLRLLLQNWPSAILTSLSVEIVLRELLGYDVWINETYAGGGSEAWDRIGTHQEDIALEIWDYYPQKTKMYTVESQSVVTLGKIYDGVSTIFMYLPEEASKLFNMERPDFMVYSYKNQEVVKYLGSFGSLESIIQSDEAMQAEILAACGNWDNSVDFTKPKAIFDPWNCYGEPTCFEWLRPFQAWSKNVFEQLIVNLELPVYMTFWDLEPPCDSWGGNIFTAYRQLQERKIPHFYEHYTPDGNADTSHRLFFKSETSKCLAESRSDNSEGIGSRDCYEGNTDLITIVNPMLIDEDAYRDAADFLMRFDPTNVEIDYMLERHKELGNEYDTSCEWLKNNQDRIETWISGLNQYNPPDSSGDDISIETMLLIVFGMICILSLALWMAQSYGIFKCISTAIVDDFFSSFIACSWKVIDFSMTVVGLVEILGMEAGVGYRMVYISFVGVHSVCFACSVYSYYLLFTFLETHNNLEIKLHASGNLRVYEAASGQTLSDYEETEYLAQRFRVWSLVALTGCFSFLLEDLLGSILTLYALYHFEEAQESLIFFVVTGAQLFETGLSSLSFHDYGRLLEAYRIQTEKSATLIRGSDSEDDSSVKSLKRPNKIQKEYDI